LPVHASSAAQAAQSVVTQAVQSGLPAFAVPDKREYNIDTILREMQRLGGSRVP
jgi:hypothetical protein